MDTKFSRGFCGWSRKACNSAPAAGNPTYMNNGLSLSSDALKQKSLSKESYKMSKVNVCVENPRGPQKSLENQNLYQRSSDLKKVGRTGPYEETWEVRR